MAGNSAGPGTPVDRVRSALQTLGAEFARDRGHEFHATCPLHDDPNPSLHVSTGDAGQAVFYCQAGCTREPNDRSRLVETLGLQWSDLFVGDGFGVSLWGSPDDGGSGPQRARVPAGGGVGVGVGGEHDGGSATTSNAGSTASSGATGSSGESGDDRDWQRPWRGAWQREARLHLVQKHREGTLPYPPMWLDEWPPLPAGVSRNRRLVADHCKLVRALLVASDDYRPFVLPSDEVAEELGLAKYPTRKAMDWLMEIGFLTYVDELPSHPRRKGAFLYLPGKLRPDGSAVEQVEAAVPPVTRSVEANRDAGGQVDQRQEVREHVPVGEAVALDRGMVLERDRGRVTRNAVLGPE